MSELRRTVWMRGDDPARIETLEWLVSNGLGGYASGVICGPSTRRFHGLLVAALPAPRARMLVLNGLEEEITTATGPVLLTAPGVLREFRLELGLPVWTYDVAGTVVEKRIVLPHRQNTVHATYTVLEGAEPVTLRLRPWFHMRPHEGLLADENVRPYPIRAVDDLCDIEGPHDLKLRTTMMGNTPRLILDGGSGKDVSFAVERARGYDFEEKLWSPGYHEVQIGAGAPSTFVASIEPWDRVEAMPPAEVSANEHERRVRLLTAADGAHTELARNLVLAADQFVITPQSRVADAARARAVGIEASTVIAGYHWFTDWGRDTMISLEGLTLVTKRFTDAEAILRMFAYHVKDGLLPNMFPEGESEGVYHTADASMWFFHAIARYVGHTGDLELALHLLPTLEEIIAKHISGTRFGIGVDPADGLLTQGAEGYQLTWMDAKVGDWVVTPRRGKAVEINALFYNALRLLQGWLVSAGRPDDAAKIGAHADRNRESFNKRFWNAEKTYLFDVVDGPSGNDDALRPNQVFAISLDHPILDENKWSSVIAAVQSKLLTPLGLRSLSPDHKDYQPRYDGDLRARDAAYHQGTVWGWLIGPFADAYAKAYPADKETRERLVAGFVSHLSEACAGTISEIFDATEPFAARGCVAQAWSVAEVLRLLCERAAPETK